VETQVGYDIDMAIAPAGSIPGYEPQFADCPGYIRFAGMSMPYMVEIMQAAGLLDDADPPKFPAFPPGLPEGRADDLSAFFDDGEAIDPPPTPAERELMVAFLAGRAKVEAARSQQPDRVPRFKFRSNDNWLVCPEECRIIADGLTQYADANEGRANQDIDWSGVRQWAAYNRVAAEHGGYRVN
jgi:hypothetical protein